MTDRLIIRPFTRTELEADFESRAAFERAMASVRIAPDWPNKHWEPPAVRWLLDKMDKFADEPLWRAWVIMVRGSGTEQPIVVGTIGFKGPPGADGLVEFGYGIVTSMWRRGIASEAARAMVQWAKTDPRVRGVCGHTMPNDPASSGVLRKCGMDYVGLVHDAEDGDIDRFEKWFTQPAARDYDRCIVRVKELLKGADPFSLALRARQEAVTKAYWECFGSTDPASEAELRAGRGVSWCGFYDIVPGVSGAAPFEMVLVCREPKPACSPIGLHGMCGRGWREERAFVVRDVRVLGADYVACDPKDQSELVVPVFEGGRCVGVFDVDSYHVGAFTKADADGAEKVLAAAGIDTSREPGNAAQIL